MKAIVIFAAALAVFATPAFAKSAAQTAAQDNMKSCSANWKAMSDTQKKATTRKDFMSGCLSKSSSATAAPATAAPATKTAAANNSMSGCAATWKTKSDADKKSTTYKSFMSSCMKSNGSVAAAPAPMSQMAAKPPAPKKIAAAKSPGKSAIPTEGNTGTSARCKDGKTIAIKSHNGACSRHGGVAAWL
ncbi:MAG TPA: DUF3761 domain-containing protein [Rhizomicrobium sp.]